MFSHRLLISIGRTQCAAPKSNCVHVDVCECRQTSVLACTRCLWLLPPCSGSAEACPNWTTAKKAPPRLHRTGSGLFCFTEASVLLSPTCLALNPSSSWEYLWSIWQSLKSKRCCVVSVEKYQALFNAAHYFLLFFYSCQSLFFFFLFFFVLHEHIKHAEKLEWVNGVSSLNSNLSIWCSLTKALQLQHGLWEV